jgi:L-alanine-DL-glutamate epimerase-like enolase superfamily enzyme
MSRVAKIELFHVAIPLPAPFYPAWIPGMPQTENRFTLIRVTTDDGVVGHSAGPAIARERAGLGDLLGPYLLGEDANGPQASGLVLHPHSRHQVLEGD